MEAKSRVANYHERMSGLTNITRNSLLLRTDQNIHQCAIETDRTEYITAGMRGRSHSDPNPWIVVRRPTRRYKRKKTKATTPTTSRPSLRKGMLPPKPSWIRAPVHEPAERKDHRDAKRREREAKKSQRDKHRRRKGSVRKQDTQRRSRQRKGRMPNEPQVEEMHRSGKKFDSTLGYPGEGPEERLIPVCPLYQTCQRRRHFHRKKGGVAAADGGQRAYHERNKKPCGEKQLVLCEKKVAECAGAHFHKTRNAGGKGRQTAVEESLEALPEPYIHTEPRMVQSVVGFPPAPHDASSGSLETPDDTKEQKQGRGDSYPTTGFLQYASVPNEQSQVIRSEGMHAFLRSAGSTSAPEVLPRAPVSTYTNHHSYDEDSESEDDGKSQHVYPALEEALSDSSDDDSFTESDFEDVVSSHALFHPHEASAPPYEDEEDSDTPVERTTRERKHKLRRTVPALEVTRTNVTGEPPILGDEFTRHPITEPHHRSGDPAAAEESFIRSPPPSPRGGTPGPLATDATGALSATFTVGPKPVLHPGGDEDTPDVMTKKNIKMRPELIPHTLVERVVYTTAPTGKRWWYAPNHVLYSALGMFSRTEVDPQTDRTALDDVFGTQTTHYPSTHQRRLGLTKWQDKVERVVLEETGYTTCDARVISLTLITKLFRSKVFCNMSIVGCDGHITAHSMTRVRGAVNAVFDDTLAPLQPSIRENTIVYAYQWLVFSQLRAHLSNLSTINKPVFHRSGRVKAQKRATHLEYRSRMQKSQRNMKILVDSCRRGIIDHFGLTGESGFLRILAGVMMATTVPCLDRVYHILDESTERPITTPHFPLRG